MRFRKLLGIVRVESESQKVRRNHKDHPHFRGKEIIRPKDCELPDFMKQVTAEPEADSLSPSCFWR